MNIKRTVEMKVQKDQLMMGDKIQMGDSMWKVLDIQPGKALIWKCSNIKDYVFNANDSNEYEGSDIQKYLKTGFWEDLPDELLKMVDGDFFLLTEDQVMTYMPREIDRIATDENDYTTWWWTATPNVGGGYRVRYIDPSGLVSYNGASYGFGVAPACWINL